MESETAGASRKEASPTGLTTERPGLAELDGGPNHSLPGILYLAEGIMQPTPPITNTLLPHNFTSTLPKTLSLLSNTPFLPFNY